MMRIAESILQDVRFALRSWTHSPGFATAAVITLAMGIGANTAMFSVVSGVLLQPLPFGDSAGLVQIYERVAPNRSGRGFDGGPVFGDLQAWRSHSQLLKGAITYTISGRSLLSVNGPEQVGTVATERGLFQLLEVKALLGRTLAASDSPRAAVVSYELWRNRLGSDPAAVGHTLVLDGESFTIIGVMPRNFRFPYVSTASDSPIGVWIPWDPPPHLRANLNARVDAAVARLQPGASVQAVREELAAIVASHTPHREVRVERLKDVISGPVRNSLLVLSGAVGLVLLVACVNVANLLLAPTASREREIAIRTSLGASRVRLLRQLLTESLLLAAAGGALGLVLSVWGRRILVQAAGAHLPRAGEIGLDWNVFAFLLAVCLAAAICFGLAPALTASRGGTASLQRRGVGWALRDALVVVQVSLAFLLLSGAGLLLKTFLHLQETDAGFRPQHVLTAHVVVADARQAIALEQKAAQIPGVLSAGMISLLPLQNSDWSGGIVITGQPGVLECELRYVTPGYFSAMGIPLRCGQTFHPSDGPNAQRVIVVNETLARTYFPNGNAIGRQTDRGTILGIVGDVRQVDLRTAPKPEVYYTLAQNFAQMRRHGSTLIVRTSGPAEGLVTALREAVRTVSPDQAVFRVATMEEVVDESLASPRLYAWLTGLFAAMGTLLAMAGLYGVIAYLVELRRREFGIRMALGADRRRILRQVLSRGSGLVAAGIVCGIAGSLALTQLMSAMLYGVTATDPWTFGSMGMLLMSVGLAACFVPARRAASVNPAVALRSE
ncbi:MAG: ABC transporter permease [Acidobacteria bacterium]|nr:ABC transporter permease [Acidobacteriota bacterium]